MSAETNFSSVYSLPFFLSVTYSLSFGWHRSAHLETIAQPLLQLDMAAAPCSGKWNVHRVMCSSESLLLKENFLFLSSIGLEHGYKGTSQL